MKRMKWIALVLIAVLLCTLLPACSGDTEEPTATKPTMNFDENDGPLVSYEETLTVTQVRYLQPSTTYIRGEGKNDNFIRDFYKEKLNIEMETVWEAEYTSYFTKLNLDIASDDLPDIFMVDGAQLQTLIENDQIEDLSQYYEYYASDLLRQNVEYNNGYLLQFPTVNGGLYGLPRFTSYAGETAFMWIRTDWMEELDLEAPTTWEEFTHFIKTLKESGLCTNNSSGFSFLGVASESFDAITQMYGAYYDYFIDDGNGNLIYSGVTPEMKNALAAMQEMYKAGLIDADWASKGSTEEEMIASGQYGIVFGRYFYPFLLKGSLLNDPNADWGCFPVPSYDDSKQSTVMGTNYTNGYIVVRKGYEHPEALIKLMNLWCELNVQGGQYVDWLAEKTTGEYKSVNLLNEYMFPYAMEGVNALIDSGKALDAVLGAENPNEEIKKYPYIQTLYDKVKDPAVSDWVSGNGWWNRLVYTGSAKVLEGYIERGMQFNEFQGMLTEESAFNKVSLDSMMVEAYTNIIMGDSIDTFDQFVEDWYDMGGQEILDEANAWYKANKK